MKDKVVRDGKVAVLYSPGFGAGWYSWNKDYPEMLTSPLIVELIENKVSTDQIIRIAEELWPNAYLGGAKKLEIEWVPEGEQVHINEYDGSESIEVRSCDENWITL